MRRTVLTNPYMAFVASPRELLSWRIAKKDR
jgi:hypothetical protein